MNIIKLCSTDRELRLVNEIAWRHALPPPTDVTKRHVLEDYPPPLCWRH